MNAYPFTVEEENLICIYDTDNRSVLINSINDAILHFDESELHEIAESTVKKLEAMTDTEFSALTFNPAYHGDDDEAEEV